MPKKINPATQAQYWRYRQLGKTKQEAAKMCGIHYNTALNWEMKLSSAKLAHTEQQLGMTKAKHSEGNKGTRDPLTDKIAQIEELNGPLPYDALNERARRGLEDFDYFRRIYLGRAPSPWQVEAAYKIVELLDSDDREFLCLNVPPGAGKALALDTPLRTPTGWTTIRDVQPGDYVIGVYGEPVMVLAKSEVFHDHDCYRVATDDGYSVVADANHLWPVRLSGEGKYKYTGRPNALGKTGPKTRGVNGIRTQTTEMLAKPRNKRPELQIAYPLIGVWEHLIVDPYVLGYWLGDGETAGARIACHQDDQPEVRDYFEQAGVTTVQYPGKQSFGTKGLRKLLRRIGVLGNKHIPAQYLNATYTDRMALLQGLVDSDGHVGERGNVEFCTTNPILARQVRDLVLSLGVKCSFKESRATLYGKDCGPRWRLAFMMEGCARLTRKANRTRNAVRTPNRYLTVTPTESVPTQCIQVDGGLFLAGEGLLVTHNSTLFHDVAVWMICRNRKIRILIGSISGRLASQYSRRVRETLERTEPFEPSEYELAKGLAVQPDACLVWDYGRFKPITAGSLWRAEEFIVEQVNQVALNNKEPTVSSYGLDAEFIGHRADLCLFDDVANPENSREGVTRDRLLEKWDSVAEARCEPGGLLSVIGQRLSSSDLYAHVLSKKAFMDEDDDDAVDEEGRVKEQAKYHHIVYKAYYEDLDTGPASKKKDAPAYPNGPLLDPMRLPWKDITYLRSSNRTKFDIVYQQEADAEQGNLILKVHALGGMGPDGVMYPGCVDRERDPGYIPPNLAEPVVSIATVDPSPTEFWGVQWWLYQPDTNLRFLVDLERTRLTAEDLLGFNTIDGQYSGIMDEWQHRSVAMGRPITHWVIEINAAQRFLLAHDFVRRWQALNTVNIIPHTTHRNKWDEARGIEALLPPLWRSGAVRLPSMRTSWKTLALIHEMTAWRPDKKHGTDLVMAHWFAELHWPTVGAVKTPPRMWRPSWMREAI